MEAEALYELLERDVVPTFYERGADRLPRRWIERMKASLGSALPFLQHPPHGAGIHREFYLPAHERSRRLAADDAQRARALAAWKERVRQSWPEVRVEFVENHSPATLPVGQPIQARVRVHLGALTPDDVAVELYHGRVNADGEIVNAVATAMQPAGPARAAATLFEAQPVACTDSGLHGYTVRVLPYHPDLPAALIPGFISWAQAS